MKKILFILMAFLAVSCSKQKLADLNKDVKHPTNVPGSTLFSNAEKNLSDQDVSLNVNRNNFDLWSQYLTETTYTDESNYNIFSRNVPDNAWSVYYRAILENLKRADSLIKMEKPAFPSDVAAQKNKLAIIDIVACFTWDQMETLWGNIPYSQALNINNVQPAYDDALTIHKKLISRVTADVAALDATNGSFGSADLIYNGDVAKWKEFGNGLLVKMAIQIANVTSESALVKSTIQGAMGGAISSAADNAMFKYLSSSPNTNPLYVDLVMSGRLDYVAANTIINKLASLYDPRLGLYFSHKIPVYFKPNNATDTVFTDVPLLVFYNTGTDTLLTPETFANGEKGIVFQQADKSLSPSFYLGGNYGHSSAYPNYSHINTAISHTPTFPHPLMTYSEIQFYLAEAAARGIIAGDAATYYNNAVTASILFWGGTPAQAAAYLAQPTVTYDQANWKELIGTQAWISFYLRGYLGWTEWRRLRFPKMNEPPTPATGVVTFPFRYPYPSGEQTLNNANYTKAANAIGGDKMSTKLYWENY